MAALDIFLLLLLACTANSLKLLLPLYIYPSYLGYWDPIFNVISAHPDVQFEVVINPNNGAGTAQFPNSDYVAGIDRLHAFPNVAVLGYVHVTWGVRPVAEVQAEIDTYAGWAAYEGASIAVDGIFFDQVNHFATGDNHDYLEALCAHSHAVLGPAGTTVLNMGTRPAASDFYGMCSEIIVFESSYDSWVALDILGSFIHDGFAGQSSVLLHSFNSDETTLGQVIESFRGVGLASAYITSDCCYSSVTSPVADFATVARYF